ncbi:MAG: NAD(P)H-dependent oxidoreductase [Candidatus Bathyarchaeota archaeon]|nr:MAG: NAD(P)H-dependent oxidoreductase [Candidatus Bathyarchaeota archaeon]
MTKNVYLVYYSKTGNTKKIAEEILESFSRLSPHGMSVRLMDARELDFAALKAADGYVIGTPNYFGAPSGYVKIFFDELFTERATLKGRPVFCFVSHGGSGDIKRLRSMCDWLELKTVGPAVAVRGARISSTDTATIETNIQEMIKLL